MERTLIDRGLAEVAERDLIRAAVLRREGDARRERDLTADDCVAAEEILVRVEEVHRAAFARRAAASLAEQLRHHLVWRSPHDERVAVVAVAREHVVVGAYGRDGADGDGLLPDVEVAEASDLAERVGFGGLLLEAADENHLVEHAQQRLVVNLFDVPVLLLPALLVLLAQLGGVYAVCVVALHDAGAARRAVRLRARLHRDDFEFTHNENLCAPGVRVPVTPHAQGRRRVASGELLCSVVTRWIIREFDARGKNAQQERQNGARLREPAAARRRGFFYERAVPGLVTCKRLWRRRTGRSRARFSGRACCAACSASPREEGRRRSRPLRDSSRRRR